MRGHWRYHVPLTSSEEQWAAAINFDAATSEGYRANLENVPKLWRSLEERQIIPHWRLCYFLDPECNVRGRGYPREEQLLQVPTPDSLIGSPRFLKHLSYFLYGPKLPPDLIDCFADAVEECGPLTSGDYEPLQRLARSLVRKHNLSSNQVSEEFMKLALECGMGCMGARYIRDTVQKMQFNVR